MAGASSNNTLLPTGNKVPKRYWQKRTRQVKYIPPEDVIKLELQTWDLRTARSSKTGKARKGSTKTTKPPGNRSKGSKSCLPKSKPTTSNRRGGSVDPHQKAGLGVGMKKGQEKPLAHKRKLAHEDAPKNAKITHAAAKGCNPQTLSH